MNGNRVENAAGNRFSIEDVSFADALRQALSLLKRSLGLMLVLGFIFATAALVGTLQLERVYKSTAQLMIERPVTSPIEVSQVAQQRADNGYVDGQVLLITSSDTLLEVIENANLLEEPAFQRVPPNIVQQAIRWVKSVLPVPASPRAALPDHAPDMATLTALSVLKDAISVDREGDTNVVSIDVRAPSPALAQRIARTVVQTYIEIKLVARDREARRLSDWIDARSEELRDQVTVAERAATTFRIENNLIGDDNTASLSDQQLTDINAELIRARADLAQKRASYERFQQVLAEDGDLLSLPEVQISPIIITLRESLFELQRRVEDAQQIGLANNPRLSQLQWQLALLQEQLDQEVMRVAKALANETEALENRTRILSAALGMANGQSGIETRSAAELRELERVAEAYRLRYERYLNNAGLAAELSSFATSGAELVSAASLPVLPVYPPTKVFVVLSFLLGIGLALMIRLLRDALSGEFISVKDVEQRTGFHVLSVLPRLADGKVLRNYVIKEPFAPFSEAVSVLRQNLRISAKRFERGNLAPVVLVTSAEDDAGKTSIAASLAESASSGGQRVLLVDADLRYAGLSELYDVDDGDGLCDILRGQEWLPDGGAPGQGIDIIPAGDLRGRQPSDCIATPHLGRFLDAARRNYDFVIIDGPPVANLADTKILAEECSQVVMVLNYKKTTHDDMLGALKQLPGEKIVGIIINRADPTDQSARWNIGGTANTSYVQTAQLYQLRNAAIEKNKAAGAGTLGRSA